MNRAPATMFAKRAFFSNVGEIDGIYFLLVIVFKTRYIGILIYFKNLL